MQLNQITSDLKNKIYYPVYFLCGEEPYYIDLISSNIEKTVLNATEKEFNQSVLYGRDIDIPTLINYAKRFPMIANHQVIIVKEAQDLSNIEDLANYIEKPVKSTILVLCYKHKKIDKRKKFVKTVDKYGVFLESKKLYENKIPDWINNYLNNKGYSITPKASMILFEYLVNNLTKITNEINKLIINIPSETEISPSHIEEYIGISKDFNIFELQKALSSKNIYKANQIVNYFAANPRENPLVKTVIILYSFFSKVLMIYYLKDKSNNNVASVLSIHPFFSNDYLKTARKYNIKKITEIISYLREYDLKSKGVDNNSADDGELLKELIYKILH